MTQVSRRIWRHGDVIIHVWQIPEDDQQAQFYGFVFLLNNILLLHLILFRFRSELFDKSCSKAKMCDSKSVGVEKSQTIFWYTLFGLFESGSKFISKTATLAHSNVHIAPQVD